MENIWGGGKKEENRTNNEKKQTQISIYNMFTCNSNCSYFFSSSGVVTFHINKITQHIPMLAFTNIQKAYDIFLNYKYYIFCQVMDKPQQNSHFKVPNLLTVVTLINDVYKCNCVNCCHFKLTCKIILRLQ